MTRLGLLGGVFAVVLGGMAGGCMPQPDQVAPSCQYARDNECDEDRYGGTGLCPAGTDTVDCARATAGDNSCRYARDNECDEPDFGTGFCDAGSDTADCLALRAGGDDSCRWANDGECDEAGIGTASCVDGTDATDCRAVYDWRHRNNYCASSFDGVCDEPEGTDRCAPRTDTVDCLGRATPRGIRDHYFGTDDRRRMVADGLPWTAIGVIEFPDGECTATLVAPSVVLTAAHCFYDRQGERIEPIRFRAGVSGFSNLAEAGIERSRPAPAYRPDGAGSQGNDWGLAVLDRPIGDEIGTVPIRALTAGDLARIADGSFAPVVQAGYPWDSPTRLVGHLGCRIVVVRDDNSILHECDTTEGDSGSPIMIEGEGGQYFVIAVDSEFFDAETGGPRTNLAVDSRAFATAVAKYLRLTM